MFINQIQILGGDLKLELESKFLIDDLNVDYSNKDNIAAQVISKLHNKLSKNKYDKSDTFVKSDTVRDDEIITNSLTLSGNLEDLIKNKYIKNVFYNLSYSDIESSSNILNYDYDKEIIKFGLTKRMMF